MGPGTLELSGANTYTGTNQVVDGTMILSGGNSATGYTLAGYANDIYPVLKVSAANALNSSATLAGSSSSVKTGTLEFTTAGGYTLNQYNIGNMNFSNSSGSAATLTFTNAMNTLSTGGGRALANKSANLTITFNGELDISGTSDDTCSISTIGPVVISNRVFNSSSFTRNLEKLETGTLTMSGVNSYNGTTTVSRGTLSIPTGGSLTGCGTTIVSSSSTSAANSANLNLAGAAGVVQVGQNGYVRGYTSGSSTTLGTITSLQVQNGGTVEVALGSTWTTDGTIEFAVGSKVSVTGTPITGNTYTLMTASADITGSPILVGAAGWALRVNGVNLLLEEIDIYNIGVGVTATFSDIITGTAPLVKKGFGMAIIKETIPLRGERFFRLVRCRWRM
jgi:autotransporter-associated beta strand protein